jgi:PPK2 family polyphosphate:nucleotide phosphotransferase
MSSHVVIVTKRSGVLMDEGVKMKIDSKNFRVKAGETIKLKKWPTRIESVYKGKGEYRKILGNHLQKLNTLQNLLYAGNQYSLLLIFQGMDAAGKDGVIKHVMSGINPQGCEVFSFKQPSVEELEHDFLWRTTRHLPERGHIGIFNRSYYEEVLIVRVHPELLRNEGFQDESIDKSLWEGRYRSIVDLEGHLHRNGTRILKFFLHLSKDEQRLRFLARIDEPDKNWKFNRGDIEERKFWGDYRKAYEACLSATSTKESPWYIVPADDKENARVIVSQIVSETLTKLGMNYPELDQASHQELQSIRKLLENEVQTEDEKIKPDTESRSPAPMEKEALAVTMDSTTVQS